MNERAVSLLEQYELVVEKTRKGRSAIICECESGLYIFKEYFGTQNKLESENKLLQKLAEKSGLSTDQIIPTKEGALSITDADGCTYFLKTHFEGKECNVGEMSECVRAVETLARLHPFMEMEEFVPTFDLLNEFEKHNRELKKVKSYLKQKSQKSNFEIYLQQNFEPFYESALEATEGLKSFMSGEAARHEGSVMTICHGEFWYHNLISKEKGFHIINFEKCIADYQIRDLYHFLRKLLEKNNWSIQKADTLINSYSRIKPISIFDLIQMYYRFSYPEKFWKIANFYMNGQKVWIPDKTCEKLAAVLDAKKEKEAFLDSLAGLIH